MSVLSAATVVKMISRIEVITGFQAILGRPPESEDTIEYYINYPSVAEFGHALLASQEFATRSALNRMTEVDRSRWVKVDIPDNLGIWVSLNDDGVSAGCLRGSWEAPETEFILSLLKPGGTFVDVGANIGWYTLRAAQRVGPGGLVYAFEPRSDLFSYLKRSVKENGLEDVCRLEPVALGSERSQKWLAWDVAERNPGHSFLAELPPNSPTAKRESVEVHRLDQHAFEKPVDLIKIDVEGAEYDVIAGAWELIARDLPIIVSELFPRSLRQVGGVEPIQLIHQLDSLGYTAYRLTAKGLGNQIFSIPDDIDSYYLYFTIVLLPPTARNDLLDKRLDQRVIELQKQLSFLMNSERE